MTLPIPTKLRTLTRDEVKRLLAAAHGHPDEALLLVALAAGLRRGELVALRWQDVELEQRMLLVRRALDNAGELAEPKTGPRQIVLPVFLVEVLQQHRERQNERRQAKGSAWQNPDRVFATMDGGFRRSDHLSQHVEALARQAMSHPSPFTRCGAQRWFSCLRRAFPLPSCRRSWASAGSPRRLLACHHCRLPWNARRRKSWMPCFGCSSLARLLIGQRRRTQKAQGTLRGVFSLVPLCVVCW